MSSMGTIELIVGPMFSGKTELLISRVRREAFAGHHVLVIKYSGDTRYSDEAVASHAGGRLQTTPETEYCAAIRVVRANALSEVSIEVTDEVVGIDEGQFYPDLIRYCELWARCGMNVIVAGLDGDSKRNPFGEICNLMPLCESVTKLHGVCMVCRRRASAFSRRLEKIPEVVKIGGRELYQTVCRSCYYA